MSSVESIGSAANIDLNATLTSLFVGLITIRPIFVGSRLAFETMNRAISAHQFHPVIDRVFAFEQAKEAYRYITAGRHLGKVIILGS